MKNLFKKIVAWENVTRAYQLTQRGHTCYKVSAIRFAQDHITNLKELQQELISGTYKVSEYSTFKVYEPKERVVCAPAYRDKIVQHMIYARLRDIYEPCFIFDSYSCIRGKGNQRAVKRIHHFIRKAKWMHGNKAYVVKMDIKKFFYSLNHDILKRILRKKVTCEQVLQLIFKIIDSSPTPIGLPLGNLTSQLFANIYMNELDHYIKRELKCKFYVRYADDLFFILPSKQQAKNTVVAVKSFIEKNLSLRLNSHKTIVNKVTNGVSGLGFVIKPTHIQLRKTNKSSLTKMLKNPKIKPNLNQSLNSWLNFAQLADHMSFVSRTSSYQTGISIIQQTGKASSYRFEVTPGGSEPSIINQVTKRSLSLKIEAPSNTITRFN